MDRGQIYGSDVHDSSGGFFSWVGKFFLFLFVFILILIALGLMLSPVAFEIFSLYVLIKLAVPWAMSAMMAAGLSHALATFIVLAGFSGLFATMVAVFLGTVAVISLIRGKDTGLEKYLKNRIPDDQDESSKLKLLLLTVFLVLSLLFALPVGLGVGIYLSVLIMPSVIAAMGGGILPTFAGVFLAFALIGVTESFFLTPLWLIWRYIAIPGWKDIADNYTEMLAFLGMLGGLAAGAYFATFLYPVLLTALTALAIPHSAAVLASLIVVFDLIFATSFLVFGVSKGLAHLFAWMPKEAKQPVEVRGTFAPSNVHLQPRWRLVGAFTGQGPRLDRHHQSGNTSSGSYSQVFR